MQLERFEENGQVPTNLKAGQAEVVQADEVAKVIVDEVNTASVLQPTSVEFISKYWSNAVGIATEIKTGELNKENVQKKLDTFVATLKVE